MTRLLLGVTLERICKAVLLLCLLHFVIIMILYFDVYAQHLDFFSRFNGRNSSRAQSSNSSRPNGTAPSCGPAGADPASSANHSGTEKPLPPCQEGRSAGGTGGWRWPGSPPPTLVPPTPAQYGEDTFNRAKLLNVGFLEALKDEDDYGCFIFSDVDLVPMDDRNLYRCYEQPRHFAIAMDKLPYAGYFGGVSGLSRSQFLKINGFPNEYWGWGGEDDDIFNRISLNGMKVSRPSGHIGRYRMIKHERDKHNEPNPQRFTKIQNTKVTMKRDGISSLQYRLVEVTRWPMYTNITVDIGKPPPRPARG
ncbi:PRELI domain-containing protein 1, mitochondrial [Platysternon megacephalum]|uniref:Beta-1,4-galactosyltransferase n=1 Tax=Platysternon megacephalum TaxID=55544 RepID=A0A4D9E0Z2_9SAUR|nr:PRELI domain-containing protein 1, mitochondrial [Platysternon megacephalum]